MDTKKEIEDLHHAFINLEMGCHRLEEVNRELLAALQDTLAVCEARGCAGPAIDSARSAIAKATGDA